jgi:cytoskeleton protein RodZ
MMEQQVEPQPSTRVGSLLRNYRLRAGLDLAEMAQRSRIRQPFLEAIESGRFEALPAPVYALGFVRSYAEQLGLDAEEIVRRFKSEVANPGAGAPLHFPLPIAAEAGTPKGAVLLLGAIIALGAYAAWYLTSSHRIDMAEIVSPVPERLEQLLNGDAAAPAGSSTPVDRTVAPHSPSMAPAATHSVPTRETQIAISSAGGGSAAEGAGPGATGVSFPAAQPVLPLPPSVSSPSDTATRDETAPSGKVARQIETASAPGGQTGGQSGVTAMAAEPPDGIGPLASDAAGRIVLKARADSWVEVRDPESNATLVARLLKTGDVYRIPDKRGLKLLTGNAGGLVVMVDGQLAPPLGKDGAVRRGVALDPESLRKGTEGSSPQ